MTESSFDKIKNLMKIVGGKAIIVEDGKPTFVIINVDEYTDFNKTKNTANDSTEEKEEKINQDIEIWKTKQAQKNLKQFNIKDDFIGLNNEKKLGDEITIDRL